VAAQTMLVGGKGLKAWRRLIVQRQALARPGV